MAKNVYLTYKNLRKDTRKITGDYAIDPVLDECIKIENISNNPATVLLPDAVPGREHEFLLSGFGSIAIDPGANATLEDSTGERKGVGVFLDAHIRGSMIVLSCERYGEWRCKEAIGTWQTPLNPVQPAGEGKEGSPYLIANLDNLAWACLNEDEWDKHYRQTANIDATSTQYWFGGQGFRPIGRYDWGDGGMYFTGSYNGQDYTITGLHIHRDENDPVTTGGADIGMFGVVETHHTIQRVHLIDCNINGTNWIGSLIAYLMKGNVTRCSASGSVAYIDTGTPWDGADVGGLIGSLVEQIALETTVSRCYSACTVTGRYSVGGFAGYMSRYTLENCHAVGNVVGLEDVGGFIGDSGDGANINIDKCYSAGTVTGDTDTGGFIGGSANLTASNVYNCFWDTQTSGQANSRAGTGKLTAIMKTQATFDNPRTSGLGIERLGLANLLVTATGNNGAGTEDGNTIVIADNVEATYPAGSFIVIDPGNANAEAHEVVSAVHDSGTPGETTITIVGTLAYTHAAVAVDVFDLEAIVGDVDCKFLTDYANTDIIRIYVDGNAVVGEIQTRTNDTEIVLDAPATVESVPSVVNRANYYLTGAVYDFTTLWAIAEAVNNGYPNLQDLPY